MSEAEALAEALRRAGQGVRPNLLAEAMSELAALTRKAAAEDRRLKEALDNGLDRELADALAKGAKLTPEQLGKLAAALRGGKGALAGRLGRLSRAGLIDADALEQCKECGKCDSEALVAFLAKDGNKACLADLLCLCKRGGR